MSAPVPQTPTLVLYRKWWGRPLGWLLATCWQSHLSHEGRNCESPWHGRRGFPHSRHQTKCSTMDLWCPAAACWSRWDDWWWYLVSHGSRMVWRYLKMFQGFPTVEHIITDHRVQTNKAFVRNYKEQNNTAKKGLCQSKTHITGIIMFDNQNHRLVEVLLPLGESIPRSSH